MAEKSITNYKSLLFSKNRDFLIRKNGDKVKGEEALGGKTIGVYFSAHWCPPCRMFTPRLVDVYNEIKASHGGGFEVVFVSADQGVDSFNGYFSEMPWLAVPFSDEETREKLDEAFGVEGIPHLAIIDGTTGELVKDDAAELVREYMAEAFPFTKERLEELKKKEEEAKRNQTVTTVLASASRSYLLAPDGSQVQVSDLKGKMVAIYFSANRHSRCVGFSKILSKMCSELKQKGEVFEVVLVALDHDEEDYKAQTKGMPWLALPFKDQSIEKLIRYFELSSLPTVVLLGADGKTLNNNVAEVIEEHGVSAYPFSQEKLAELAELEKKRMEEQTLESLLVFDELDYVAGKDGAKVPVKDLVGKVVLLYFSAHWCPPCRAFTPRLVEVYNELKSEQCDVEVIFVSSDRDQSSFDEYYSSMPWLALPYGDTRKSFLSRTFKIEGIPMLVALSKEGRTLTTSARGHVMDFGAKAFPFTEEHIKKLTEEAMKEEALKYSQEAEGEKEDEEEDDDLEEGYVCEGDVCRRA